MAFHLNHLDKNVQKKFTFRNTAYALNIFLSSLNRI